MAITAYSPLNTGYNISVIGRMDMDPDLPFWKMFVLSAFCPPPAGQPVMNHTRELIAKEAAQRQLTTP